MEVSEHLREVWPELNLKVDGAANADVAQCDLVVVATPWEGTVSTLEPLAPALAGKVVISMVNALAKEGREFLALVPPRGSMAASIQAVLPDSLVSASLHHLPASEMIKLDVPLQADVLVCSDHPDAIKATVDLIDGIEGLRGIDAGTMSQAAPIEAFTAVLISVNIRHKVHSTVVLAGFDS
ncbi:MAG: 8-hydroxy-5-deazaflavin:NADPH oxidoreductase [Acidimicrobiaceae bacterium]|nr:8-hydroxy-5-deazaflavin:NADPH oxidoreductase [Acidimicrobiaceae bacterium]